MKNCKLILDESILFNVFVATYKVSGPCLLLLSIRNLLNLLWRISRILGAKVVGQLLQLFFVRNSLALIGRTSRYFLLPNVYLW